MAVNLEGIVEKGIEKPESGRGIAASAGKMAETTVQGDEFGEYYWKKFLPLAFGGHCYYCRQDYTDVGLIHLPDKVRDRSQFVTVLGIGPRVGMKPSKEHQVKYGWPDGYAEVNDVKVGDRLLVLQLRGEVNDPRIRRSPLNWDVELFLEESMPVAIVED